MRARKQVPEVEKLLSTMFDAMELANRNPSLSESEVVGHTTLEIERIRGAIYAKLRGALQDWHRGVRIHSEKNRVVFTCRCNWCFEAKRQHGTAQEVF